MEDPHVVAVTKYGHLLLTNASVCWPNVTHIVALAREVISYCPSRPQAREDIVGRLSTAFSAEDKPVQLKDGWLQEAHELPAR